MAVSPGGPVRIIIVDDNEQSCVLLRRFFDIEDDLDVVGMAYSGCDGVELASQLQPDLVLADFNLPDIDGGDLTATIRRAMPHIPVVVMSAECETWVADRVREAGAKAFVQKNGNVERIINVIRQTVGV